jgi:cellulose synthase/poly-beta-1,6-N-acetylglucosamine synthase-like glycosyltransferase
MGYSSCMLTEVILFLLSACSAVIFLIHLGLACGMLLNKVRDLRRPAPAPADAPTRVSVIIAAKDEERLLPRLLSSLEMQTHAGFEVVLIDDRSSDSTGEIMEEYKRKHGERIKVVHNSLDPVDVNPKQAALDQGLREAGGDVLLFSDSDCELPATWVENLLRYFDNPRVGTVFGQIAVKGSSAFLDKYQWFDQALIHQYSCGTAGLGLPTSCFGNNLGARRSVIEEIGGFKALGYTLTEDAALISEAGKKGWKVRVSTREDTTIFTAPQASWRSFINQHVRWNSGGFFSTDLMTRLGYRTIVLFLLCSTLALPFACLMPFLLILPVTSFISIGLIALLLGLLYCRNKSAYLLRLLPNTLFFMLFYSYVTLLCLIRVSPEWKGRKLRSKPRGAETRTQEK